MLRSVALLAGAQVVSTAMAILLAGAIGRVLEPSEYGVLYLVASMTTFSYVFVEWGHALYGVRRIAQSPASAGEIVGSVMSVRAASALLASGAAALVAWFLGYGASTIGYVAANVLAYLPVSIALACSLAFRGLERMEYDAALYVALKAFALVLVVAALALGGRVLGVIVAQGLAGVAAAALALALYRRMAAGPLVASAATAREVVRGAASVGTLTVAIALQPYVDAVLLSKLAPTATVGWYGAATNFVGTLMAPAAIIGTAAYPRFSRAASNVDELRAAIRSVLRPLLVVGALVGAGTYLFADLAISLVYGRGPYAPAGDILRAYAPVLPLVFAGTILGGAGLAAGRTRTLATAKIGAVASVAALELALVPLFERRFANGGLGVVLALGMGELVMVTVAATLAPRGTFDRRMAADLGRALLVALGTAAIVPLASSSTGAQLVLFGLLSAALALGTRLVTVRDLDALLSLVRRRGAAAPPDVSTR
jgi:O-antigen/teichoic acid export membrane protein